MRTVLPKFERTPPPVPVDEAGQIELLAAAGFSKEELWSLKREGKLLRTCESLVSELSEFVSDPSGCTAMTDFRVVSGGGDPIKALAEKTPAERAELKRQASLTFRDFLEGRS